VIRERIVNALAAGDSKSSIAKTLGVSRNTVSAIAEQEWLKVEQRKPNGECPECDFYETRLMEELDTLTRSGSEESIAAIHRAVEHGAN
jgi:DNA-binding NarL/FixJ family response regulator